MRHATAKDYTQCATSAPSCPERPRLLLGHGVLVAACAGRCSQDCKHAAGDRSQLRRRVGLYVECQSRKCAGTCKAKAKVEKLEGGGAQAVAVRPILEREGSGHCCADNQHADVALEGDVQRPNTGGLGEQEPVKGGRRPQQRRAHQEAHSRQPRVKSGKLVDRSKHLGSLRGDAAHDNVQPGPTGQNVSRCRSCDDANAHDAPYEVGGGKHEVGGHRGGGGQRGVA
mmetsp:Transcript_28780/g.73890  ORF Transcript_28780/g.73890 Transcript_28780/m.73890 type:complete len:227 (-) Transcript_28780:884-1564(-)